MDSHNIVVVDPKKLFGSFSLSNDNVYYSDSRSKPHFDANNFSLFVSTSFSEPNNFGTKYEIRFGNLSDFKGVISSFYIVKNRDKSIRWIVPFDLKVPHFLAFYNSPTLLSKLYSVIFRLIYLFGIQKYVFDKIHLSCDDFLDKYIPNSINYDSFTIFTGTAGENRKAIIELNINDKPLYFIKIGLTSSADNNIKNEKTMLKILSARKYESFVFPSVIDSQNINSLIISNIKPSTLRFGANFTRLHAKTIAELAKTFSGKQIVNRLPIYREMVTNIYSLRQGDFSNNGLDRNSVLSAVSKMERILRTIPPDLIVTTGVSHGDFTPWNIFVGADKLYIYDWELAKNGVPVFFDLFHFIYQSNILVGDNNIDTIEKTIGNALNIPEIKTLISELNLNTNLMHALYLCHTIAYYLCLYTKQENLHQQTHWLLKTWDEALSRVNITTEDTYGTSGC